MALAEYRADWQFISGLFTLYSDKMAIASTILIN